MSAAGHTRRQFLSLTAAAAATGARAAAGTAGATPPPRFQDVRSIAAGELQVGFVDVGGKGRPTVILLHGWPYDIHSFIDVAPRLVAAGYRVVIPYLRGYGPTRFLRESAPRNAEQSALALDVVALMDALGIAKAILAGFDWGARTAAIVAALWQERCRALVSVSGYLIGSQAANQAPLPPEAELAWWYQFYFATERGRTGYAQNRKAFARLIWELGSPRWAFDDATFDRSAAALDNADHVDVVISNYRWRLGLERGDFRLDSLERRLAAAPSIAVPTITMEGEANGAPHPDPRSYADKFTGKYVHRHLKGGIGHNLPQEAPAAFADAILAVDGFQR
ncbi:MAG TPA: alpha/beta hydrolase [Allosphingosinicella sp.]